MASLLRQRFTEDLRIRHYSDRTVDAYVRCAAKFAEFFGKSPDLLGPEEVREYQKHLTEKEVSRSTFTQTTSALRFLYGVTLKRKEEVEWIPYGRRETRLPVVLSQDELGKFFQAVENRKYRTVLMTMYGAGLRLGEALGLRVTDIDSQRMVIRVEQGKGRKDRYVELTPGLLSALREYWKLYRPKSWLFPAEKNGHAVHPTAVQKACKEARLRSGLTKPVTTHTMRHCYGTHQLEAGKDLRTIQLRLGHSSLHTTALYLHVAAGAERTTSKAIDLLEQVQAKNQKR
jgi:site-specific recombinase XerD